MLRDLKVAKTTKYRTAITILTKRIASVLCNQIIVGLGGNESKTLVASRSGFKAKRNHLDLL